MRMIKIVAQNRDRLQKTNSAKKSITAATPCFAMIRHQNALAMFLASAASFTPLNVRQFEDFQMRSRDSEWLIREYLGYIPMYNVGEL